MGILVKMAIPPPSSKIEKVWMFLDFRAILEELLWPLNLKDPPFIGTPCIYYPYPLYLGHQPQKRGTAGTAGFSCHFISITISLLVI